MTTTLKWIGYTLLALVVLVVVAVAALVTLVDPNDFRDDISAIARDRAGVELTLGGDLSWRFYPVLGFGADDVALAMQAGDPPLVRIGEIALGVKLLPLFSQRIEIDRLTIDGLQADLRVDENGTGNWERIVPDGGEQPPSQPQPPGESGAQTPAIAIPALRISNAHITYTDAAAATTYNVDLPRLELRDVSLEEPFPLVLEAVVSDGRGLVIDTRLRSQVSAQPATGTYRLADIDLTASVDGITEQSLPVTLAGDLEYRADAGSAQVDLASLQVAGVPASARLEVQHLDTEATVDGRIATAEFDGRAVMKTLGLAVPAMRDDRALRRVQVTLPISGDSHQLAVKPLVVKLDDSTLGGSVRVDLAAAPAIAFDLQLDRIDIDRYQAPPAPTTDSPAATGTGAAPAVEELIPVEPLRELRATGDLRVNSLTASGIAVSNAALNIVAEGGDMRVKNVSADLLGGSLVGGVALDVRGERPAISTQLSLSDIQLGTLLQHFTDTQLLTGTSSLTLATKTAGNDTETLLRQALGSIDLSMADAVLHGVNLYQVAQGALRDRLGNFTALVPDYQDKLPPLLSENTEINDLLAALKIENGKLVLPDFQTDTSEGHLQASGTFDLLDQGFDYRFGVELAALRSNKYLKGIRWPVHCRGNLDTAVSQWCRPDGDAVRGLLESAAKQALRDKSAAKLGEKLGVEADDEAAVKEELRRKAKAEEDRAKQKLQDALNKKLDKLFNKD